MIETRFFTKKVRENNDTIIVTIPKEVCQVLGIQKGDLIDVRVSKIERMEVRKDGLCKSN